MNIDRNRIYNLLGRVQKPGRYAGGELNAVLKDDAAFRMAICYPDLYEIGMSNNGIRILYDRVNARADLACERVFAVAPDFQELLRSQGLPLYTLESFTPLNELDMIGFNMSHELLSTNVLQVLDLGGIPLRRRDRGEDDPIVIAGGQGMSNPFPLSDFFDAVFLGDGEDGLVELIDACRSGRAAGGRAGAVSAMAAVPGVMIPSMYIMEYDGGIALPVSGPVVKKRVYRGPSSDPVKPIVPSMRVAQDRSVVEISRGCRNLCRYCHAGYYDLPYRRGGMDDLADRVMTILANTGYGEITLSSLSVGDYRDLVPLLNQVLPALTERGISVSLPSLRVDRDTLPVIERLSDVRKTSLTFAVESASEVIRKRAGKDVSIPELIDIVRHVTRRGWKVIKLYFMIGLPGCEEEDEAESLVSLLRDIAGAAGRGREINVTLSPFIPKPHTPFERERQMPGDYFRSVVRRVKDGSPRQVKIKNHDLNASIIEGIFARGDARLGEAVLDAYMAGARFDSWHEYFRPDLWFAALDRVVPFWRQWLERRDDEACLPWSLVSTGFEPVVRAVAGRTGCRSPRLGKTHPALDAAALDRAMEVFSGRYNVTSRMRLRLGKGGAACFISHLDFAEVVRRALRMACIPVAYTQGFNKHERISFAYPVPLGIESECELCDVELYAPADPSAIAALDKALPAGISVLSRGQAEGTASLMSMVTGIAYRITSADRELLDLLAGKLGDAGNITIHLEEKNRDIPLSKVLVRWSAGEGLTVVLAAGGENSIRIDTLLLHLTGREDFHSWCSVVKTAQYGGPGADVPLAD